MECLTTCEVPDGIDRRFYNGVHVHHAKTCLERGFEDSAAGWMWIDWSELDDGFLPVAGTLEFARQNGMDGILYVDVRDVAAAFTNMYGDGI